MQAGELNFADIDEKSSKGSSPLPNVHLSTNLEQIFTKLGSEFCKIQARGQNNFHRIHSDINIAKGTTDPRVDFISQVLTQISISKS